MGQSTARSVGMVGVPLVAAPHPFDILNRAQVRQVAERLYGEVEEILTGEASRLEERYARKVWLSSQEAVTSCSIVAHDIAPHKDAPHVELPREA